MTVKHLQAAINKIQEEIVTIEEDIKSTATIAEFNKAHEDIKANIEKMRQQLMQNKIKKFERDTKDYLLNKVYTWADDRKTKWRPQNKPRNKTGSTASSEASGAEAGEKTHKPYKGPAKYKKQGDKTQKDFLEDREDAMSSADQSTQSDRLLRSKTKPTKKTA